MKMSENRTATSNATMLRRICMQMACRVPGTKDSGEKGMIESGTLPPKQVAFIQLVAVIRGACNLKRLLWQLDVC